MTGTPEPPDVVEIDGSVIIGGNVPDPSYVDELAAQAPTTSSDSLAMPGEEVADRRYWRISAGTDGADWLDMFRLGRIWHKNESQDPIDLSQFPSTFSDFKAAITRYPGIGEWAARHAWRISREMEVGDYVVAISGPRAYGWGVVTGEYQYVPEPDGGKREHQRAVRWTRLQPPHDIHNISKGLKDLGRFLGPLRLTYDQFLEAIGAPIPQVGTRDVDADQSLDALPRSLLEALADDIELAHSINPRSWRLNRYGEFIVVLHVGNQSQLDFRGNRGSAALSGVLENPALVELQSGLKLGQEVHNHHFWMEPLGKFEEFLAKYAALHRRAIEEAAGGVRTHVRRRNLHDPAIVDELAHIVGRDLPQPGYVEPTSSLTETTPDDAGLDAIPESLLKVLADDIALAHSINPNSWRLNLDGDSIVLQVKKPPQFVLGGNQGTATLSGVVEDAALTEMKRDLKLGQEMHNLHFGMGPLEKFEEFLAKYAALHRQAIEEAARGVRTRTFRPDLHDQELVDAISQRLGVELPAPAYWNRNSVTGKLVIDSELDLDPLPAIRSAFAANGLTYTNAQIATFYTALQTKGFVVLSGISGTGKSKIATGFVEMLPGLTMSVRETASLSSKTSPSFTLHPTENWVAIPASQAELFPPIDEDVRQSVTMDFEGQGYEGHVILRTLAQGRPTLYLSLGSSLSAALRKSGSNTRFFATFELDDEARTVTHVAISDRPGVVEDSAAEPDVEVIRTNHLFLSVRPDWRDSTSLLGYYNPLTETYEWTEFLKFLIRAGENYQGPAEDRIAWFVILDEMNLAHVEYYFADLLSVLESGRDGNGWTKEALRLTFPDTLDDAPPDTVYLPPNLYIIGTVNMDETTHAFSPKVLDRAFTIELTDVDFASYDLGGGNGAAATLSEGEQAALLRAFSRNGRFVRIDKGEIAAVIAPNRHPEVRARLQALNMLLRRDRFHFGYRVFDEIGQYLAINHEHGMMPFHEAFDWAVMMKVLPKFSGSAARLRSPLRSVLAWAFHPTAAPESWKSVVASFATLLGEDQPDLDDFVKEAAYPVVAARAARMLLTLEQDGFVSFG